MVASGWTDRDFVLPFWGVIPGGYPSPAQGYEDEPLNVHELLVVNPAATFFFTVRGRHLWREGIRDGSILVVDRSVKPRAEDLAVFDHDGERVVGRVPGIIEGEYRVWGKVTGIVTRL
ncbi:MAG: S24 family peptidase [Planctomycetota bacterium]